MSAKRSLYSVNRQALIFAEMARILAPVNYIMSGIADAAKALLASAHGYHVLAFSGELGAGKTTLISALCHQLGVKDPVTSPTYALINEYRYGEGGGKIIYHMDWYRLRDADEAINAGMEDCLLNDAALCFVEWPEQAPEILRSPYLHIKIEQGGDNKRTLVLEER